MTELRGRMSHRDGTPRTFQTVLRYRFGDDGKPTTFLGVSIDVTARIGRLEAAGGVGFEPTGPLRDQRFSRPPPSSARPPSRDKGYRLRMIAA